MQRTLKFCKFLPDHGVEVHVLTPHDPKWFARDEHLLEAIPATTTVCTAAGSWARARPRMRTRWRAAPARPARHRGPLHVPAGADPRQGDAVAGDRRPGRASEVVRRHEIDVIMSTSPPAPPIWWPRRSRPRRGGRSWPTSVTPGWTTRTGATTRPACARSGRWVADGRIRGTSRDGADGGDRLDRPGDRPPAPGRGAQDTVIENGADFDDFEQLAYRRQRPLHDRARGLVLRPALATAVPAGAGRAARPPLRSGGPRPRARFIGEMRGEDRVFAHGLGIDGAWREEGFLPYGEVDAGTAGGGRAAAADTARWRPGRHGALGQGVRVRGRAPPDAGGGAAQRRGGQPDPLRRRRQRGRTPTTWSAISAALEQMVDGWQNGGLADVEQPRRGARPAVAARPGRRAGRGAATGGGMGGALARAAC